MKFRPLLFALVLGSCALGLTTARAAQAIKDLTLSGTTTNGSTQNNSAAHTFLSGASATFASGSTLTLNGTVTGTGTVNLGNTTLTLGTPIALTLTNATGLPLSTGVSGLGTGVATALGINTGSAGAITLFGGALGTPASGTLTNATGLPISTGVSGLGTGVATALAINTGSAGAVTLYNGALGTPSSGTLTNATGLPLSTGITGTLAVANGGTGLTTPGTSGNVLTSNGTAWVSSAPGATTTITGTANQVLANATSGTTQSGNVTLTIPSVFIFPGNASLTGTNTFKLGSTLGATMGLTADSASGEWEFNNPSSGYAYNLKANGTSRFRIHTNGTITMGAGAGFTTGGPTTVGTSYLVVNAPPSSGFGVYASGAGQYDYITLTNDDTTVTNTFGINSYQYNGTARRVMNRITFGATSLTNTAEVGYTAISTMAAGTLTEILRVSPNGFGYSTGVTTGGAVTQITSRTTGVTLNKPTGAITLVSAAGSATWQSFTLTNSAIAATDVVSWSQKSGTDKYMIHTTTVSAGSCVVTFATTGGTTTESPVLNFVVIKGSAN